MFFELYARYKVAAMFLSKAAERHGIESPTILEIGSNGNNYISEFFPQAKITPSNLYAENVQSIPDNFIEADASDLYMLEDNSFDFVISLAVLEHVPREKHRAFLSESHRVAKIGAFHAAPFDEDYVLRVEQSVSDFYESLYGVKHRWLEEHLTNGHPNMGYIRGVLKELGYDYCVFEHMDADIWDSFYKLQLAVQAHGGALSDKCERFYAEKLFHQDLSEQNVFKHIYISKAGVHAGEYLQAIHKEFAPPPDKEKLLREIDEFGTYILGFANKEKQEKLQRNIQRLCILDFTDNLIRHEPYICLYGITPNLLTWLTAIHTARDYRVRVFDGYQSGTLKPNGKANKASIEIEPPKPEELTGKTIIVFPDIRYPEIFAHLESIGAKPVFYTDIAE